MKKTEYISDIYTDKVFHWLQFMKTKKGFYLRKESLNKKEVEDNSEEAFKAYCLINDQIIDCFGTDESFLKYIETEERIAMLKLDFIINKKAFTQTLYEVEELKKREKEGEPIEYDINKEVGLISKFVGGGIINIKETTIHQYLTAKTIMKNG